MKSVIGKYISWPFIIASFILILLVFITSTAMLKPGLPYGHDTYAHATYSKLFINALSEGQFPVRWVEHVWIGFGQPLFNYYQSGFYYFVSFVNLFLNSFLLSLKTSVLLIWWIGAIFVFLFTKKYGNLSALLAVIVYIFSPYLVLDIFHRTSYPELMALSFIPGVFWSLDQLLIKSKKVFIPILAIILAIVIISHLPTLVIFAPVLLLYSVLTIYQQQVKFKELALVGIGACLGIGLAAFYLIPAIFELDLVAIQKMQSGFFDFKKHFVDNSKISTYVWGYGGSWWANSHIPWMGLTQFIIIVAALSGLVFQIHKNISKLSLFFWLGVICYCLFFIQKISVTIWEDLRFLGFIQFPWRFFMVIPISTAILSATVLQSFNNINIKIALIVLIFIINLFTVVPVLAPKTFIQADYFNLPFNAWRNHQVVRYVAHMEPGYSSGDAELLSNKNQLDKIWETSVKEGVVVEEHVAKNYQRKFFVTTQDPNKFIFKTPYYLGWRAYIDNNEVSITALTKESFMVVSVPTGTHIVEMRFTNSPIRTLANIISLISLVIVAMLAILPKLLVIILNLFNIRINLRLNFKKSIVLLKVHLKV